MDTISFKLNKLMKEDFGDMGPFFLSREMKDLGLNDLKSVSEFERKQLIDSLIKNVFANTMSAQKRAIRRSRLISIFKYANAKDKLKTDQKINFLLRCNSIKPSSSLAKKSPKALPRAEKKIKAPVLKEKKKSHGYVYLILILFIALIFLTFFFFDYGSMEGIENTIPNPDLDNDNIHNLLDDDIDGDNIPNINDDDVDGDNILNAVDNDIDGDNIPNIDDFDMDGDKIPNFKDPDLDGDKIPNIEDDDADADGIDDLKESSLCNEDTKGAIYFSKEDSHFYGCDGENWKQLDN